MRRFSFFLSVLLTVSSLTPTVTAQQATPASVSTPHPFAGESAWIAYYGSEGIGLIHSDGSGNHRVAADVPGEELLANWSPDGTKLVFTTRGGETEPLYEYDLATGTSRQLFECQDPCLGDDEPVYSPDGTQVLFIRALAPFAMNEDLGGEVPHDCSLWIGDVETGEVTQLTSNTDPPCEREYSAHWSPDGTMIIYWRSSYEDGQVTGASVWVVDADGTNARQLSDPEMVAGDPDWLPDGEWIVFSTYPLLEYGCCEVSNLYRMHPDGSGLEQLTYYTDEALRATQPRYTPDGQWILFTGATPTGRNIGIIPAEGGEPIMLVEGGVFTHNTWQPTPMTGATPVASPST